MLTEDYCSYEVSKLLNEKGLNGMCDTVIGRDGTKYDIKLYDYVEEETISCPTHQMAMKWLREEHNIIIIIEPLYYNLMEEKTSSYDFSIWYGDNYEHPLTTNYSTYEEAVEAALKYALENLR